VDEGATVFQLDARRDKHAVSVPDEKLIAKAGSTCMVLRGDQEKGR
jgi:hypothetical protein